MRISADGLTITRSDAPDDDEDADVRLFAAASAAAVLWTQHAHLRTCSLTVPLRLDASPRQKMLLWRFAPLLQLWGFTTTTNAAMGAGAAGSDAAAASTATVAPAAVGSTLLSANHRPGVDAEAPVGVLLTAAVRSRTPQSSAPPRKRLSAGSSTVSSSGPLRDRGSSYKFSITGAVEAMPLPPVPSLPPALLGQVVLTSVPELFDVRMGPPQLWEYLKVLDEAGAAAASVVADVGAAEGPPSSGSHAGVTFDERAAAAVRARLYRSGLAPPFIGRVLRSKACRGAIMFGDALSTATCQALVHALQHCHLPFQCAHGRPSAAPLLTVISTVGDEALL